MKWTDEQSDTLKTLWVNGLTSYVVAAVLGVSRNAVLGKAHRMGLLGGRVTRESVRHVKAGKPMLEVAAKLVAEHKISPPRDCMVAVPVLPPTPVPEGKKWPDDAITLADLPSLGKCKFIYGDARDAFRYCGHASGASSWCPAHREIVYAPSEKRERAPKLAVGMKVLEAAP